jgi:hypothetical protein
MKLRKALFPRAIVTDFQGKWDDDYDPLRSLKYAIEDLDHRQVPWWSLRSDKLPDQVHYPVTSAPDEWANEILGLDQLLIEGFEQTWLKKKAVASGRILEPNWQSLTFLRECLAAVIGEEGSAENIVAPLKELHHLRSKLKGHASNTDALAIKKRVLAEHGTYAKHFRALCQECDKSLRAVTELFGESLGKWVSSGKG